MFSKSFSAVNGGYYVFSLENMTDETTEFTFILKTGFHAGDDAEIPQKKDIHPITILV